MEGCAHDILGNNNTGPDKNLLDNANELDSAFRQAFAASGESLIRRMLRM